MAMAFFCTTSASKVEVLSYRHLTPTQVITRFSYQVFVFYLKWSSLKSVRLRKRFTI